MFQCKYKLTAIIVIVAIGIFISSWVAAVVENREIKK